MRLDLFPFQRRAVEELRTRVAESLGGYYRTKVPQVVSFTAPTGSGKTIIMTALIENIFFGDEKYDDQQNAIFVWLSDSPQLNEQSKMKIDSKSDKIRLGQCIVIEESSFDQETLSDGCVYFLNTQKLGKSSNLTKEGDRNYTIWETLANTVREKSDRLYFIIDEAHRGMQEGKDVAQATTIMQKFLKGSAENKIPPMPVVIGMSATIDRFNNLVGRTTSTIRSWNITFEEVKSSGLVKDLLVVKYPEPDALGNEMSILNAAAEEWKGKWDLWTQYCREQHHAYVNPILVIQVQNAKSGSKKPSETDLDACLQAVEEHTGFHFEPGEVVHAFGETSSSSIMINGLEVPYEEPSRISDNKKIKVVFFKESLSTGWDCPRAETMMSYRSAKDYTYIAQLLGRMLRTPMQQHILVYETLNNVHLYLPHFEKETVERIVEELKNAEGGMIPAEVYGESMGEEGHEVLTIRPAGVQQGSSAALGNSAAETELTLEGGKVATAPASQASQTPTINAIVSRAGTFSREEIVQFVNETSLLSYDIKILKINSYITSLFKMAHFLSRNGLCNNAVTDVSADIVKMIREHAENLKAQGKYEDLATQVREFKLRTQLFDVFGQSVEEEAPDLLMSTDEDIERQFRAIDRRIGNEGIGHAYGRQYFDEDDPSAFKIDVILFANDTERMKELDSYAEKKFHGLNNEYRRVVAKLPEELFKKYNDIVSDGDSISKHSFRLPEIITVTPPRDDEKKGYYEYSDHLFVSAKTGTTKIKLNNWEHDTIEEERKRKDFVCWIRNPSRGAWALRMPYEDDKGQTKSFYPDFIIIRKDDKQKYIIDILEPHDSSRGDNVGKAHALAKYARDNPSVGRVQLIREIPDPNKKDRPKRLDMSKSEVREKVLSSRDPGYLENLFKELAFYDNVEK